MMNINGMSASIYPISPLLPGYHTPGGSGGNGTIGGDSHAGQVGSLVAAIFQALSQSGVAGTSSATATGSSRSNPLQALGSFMQTLISALQNPSATTAQPASPSSSAAASTSGVVAVARSSGYYRQARLGGHGAPSPIESNLQDLIQQLSSGTSSAGASAPLDSLQQSFQALSSSLGNTPGSASRGLGNFLQAFAHNLERLGSTGTIVNTRA
ncbi:MAG: hypothetical protein KGM46_05570 [Pseudomonadota bacterium]|jgi:hypothetical protein|nr:hypothetical protein [Xanthomonadaceae bacterium]MDE2247545.1 hypothetical protein [Xanthomonadaceae bacterium]MDE3210189.1 hypothetical protein [Pseudomonadota bacterium]